jgi:hypothetical protein
LRSTTRDFSSASGFCIGGFESRLAKFFSGDELEFRAPEENRAGGAKPMNFAPGGLRMRLVLQSPLANGAGNTQGLLRKP